MVAPSGDAFNDSIHRGTIWCMRAGDTHQPGRDPRNSQRSPSGGRHMEERLAMGRRYEMKFSKRSSRGLWMGAAMLLGCSLAAFAQAPIAQPTPQATPGPAPSAAAPTAAPAVGAPAMDVPLDTKAAAAPSADELAKGDPSGTKIGTVSDVVAADTKKGLTLADLANQAGQNRIAINFVWTLITGFLVMFMQAGFAVVETGLTP